MFFFADARERKCVWMFQDLLSLISLVGIGGGNVMLFFWRSNMDSKGRFCIYYE